MVFLVGPSEGATTTGGERGCSDLFIEAIIEVWIAVRVPSRSFGNPRGSIGLSLSYAAPTIEGFL